jgi:hypothetical protein
VISENPINTGVFVDPQKEVKMDQKDTFEEWAIVELFGHSRIAGKITEQTIGGCSFIRIDVPEINGKQPFTKLYSQGAIYGITFVDELTAKLYAKQLQVEPINVWQLEHAMKSLPEHDEEDYDQE